MQLVIERAPFLKVLENTLSVVEKKNTVQILSNLLLSLKGKTLSVSGTDLEAGILAQATVQNGTDGLIALPAKQLYDIVKELPDRPLQIQVLQNNWVEIISGKSRFNIAGLASSEFPKFPLFEEKEYIPLQKELLVEMMDWTSFAISTDATKYQLSGAHFESLGDGNMRMTATDGIRVSYIERKIFKAAPELKKGIIIPKKGIQEIRKILTQTQGEVAMAFERGQIYIKTESLYLFVRLIEAAEFPNFKQYIPENFDKSIQTPTQEFHNALKRVSLMANEKSRGVRFTIKDGLLTIASSNPDKGEGHEEIDVDQKGENIEIGFNARYLLDCLEVMGTENLAFSLKDPRAPAILEPSPRNNQTYLIMPMRI